MEIIDTEFFISSGVRAQQLERVRGAHVFASNTLDVLSVAIDLGPGLQWRDRTVLVSCKWVKSQELRNIGTEWQSFLVSRFS